MLEYQNSINKNLEASVSEINLITKRIADLNSEIVSVNNQDQEANDLLDGRDQLLNELNSYFNVDSYEDSKGNLEITVDWQPLISKNNSYDLEVETSEANQSKIISIRIGSDIETENGSVAALVELRNESAQKYIDKINQLAVSLVDEFNKIHKEGYDLNEDSGEELLEIKNEENSAVGITVNKIISER